MLNSGIIDLAIGMAFIFGTTAGLASVITELVARFLGLRGAYLMLGLRELLDSKGTAVVLGNAETDFGNAQKIMTRTPGDHDEPESATGMLLGSPILSSQGMVGTLSNRALTVEANTTKVKASDTGRTALLRPFHTWSRRRKLPSYISARSFAEAIVDMVIPDRSGQTSADDIQQRIDKLPVPSGPLKDSLKSLARTANGDIDQFRTLIENWYDDHMARVSGWYKRRTAWITLGVGVILVVLFNINAVTIGRALYSDSATRTAVSAVAAQGNPCPASSDQQSCLSALEKRVSDAAQAGLPLGWGIVPACTVQNVKCGWLEQHGITTPGDGSWWQVFLAVLGFLATIVALAPGAQFWFGLVVKLNSLRSSGPPPASSAS
ncbi:MAG TPA: hypothetical protein VFV73_30125 [Streptosporangiaceae bacterium]|nr:hypothetical protein [Streptosporangiaceae bacterium]